MVLDKSYGLHPVTYIGELATQIEASIEVSEERTRRNAFIPVTKYK